MKEFLLGFIGLTLFFQLVSCGNPEIQKLTSSFQKEEDPKYICLPDQRYTLSSYFLEGSCNLKDGGCPSGFLKVESDEYANGQQCKEVICGSESGCITNVLQ